MNERVPDQPVAPHIVLRESGTGIQPYVGRMGFKVKMIVEWYLDGKTVQEFVDDFEFTPAEIHAAMAYYYDHKDEIDARMADDERIMAESMAENPSRIPRPATA